MAASCNPMTTFSSMETVTHRYAHTHSLQLSLLTNITPKTHVFTSLSAFNLVMESFFTAFPTSKPTTTTTTTSSSTTLTHMTPLMSQFSVIEPLTFPSTSSASSTSQNLVYLAQYIPPCHQNRQFMPYMRSLEQAGQSSSSSSAYPTYPYWFAQNGFQIGVPPASNGIQQTCQLQLKENGRRALDAYKTRVARSRRKMARQMSLIKNISSSVPPSTQVDTRRLTMQGANTDTQNRSKDVSKDIYGFCTPDNKRLRVLLRKELKNSDVGSLGRIVLPKVEAEENLPTLTDKEGTQMVITDVYSTQVWTFKFKYWSNNKSRMYVLENTANFVKQNGLESGDSLTLYEDESKNLYFSVKKLEKSAAEPTYQQQYVNDNHNYNHLCAPHVHQTSDEDEASLALQIERLKHQEQLAEANNIVTLSVDDGASSYRQPEGAINVSSNNVTTYSSTYNQPMVAAMKASSSSSTHGNLRVGDDNEINFNDCYRDLGTLPDVGKYNFHLWSP